MSEIGTDGQPLRVAIVGLVDAFDAMTHDRQYRKAMPLSMAAAILREHAGSQWDQDVVRHVLATLPTTTTTVSAFDAVGRDAAQPLEPVEIPIDVSELLAAVDAEI